MLKNILTNEIKGRIGHTPDSRELKSAIDEIKFYYEEDVTTITNVLDALDDWCSDKCFKDPTDGNFYLFEDGQEASDGTLVHFDNIGDYEQELVAEADNKKELQDRWNGLY